MRVFWKARYVSAQYKDEEIPSMQRVFLKFARKYFRKVIDRSRKDLFDHSIIILKATAFLFRCPTSATKILETSSTPHDRFKDQPFTNEICFKLSKASFHDKQEGA